MALRKSFEQYVVPIKNMVQKEKYMKIAQILTNDLPKDQIEIQMMKLEMLFE